MKFDINFNLRVTQGLTAFFNLVQGHLMSLAADFDAVTRSVDNSNASIALLSEKIDTLISREAATKAALKELQDAGTIPPEAMQAVLDKLGLGTAAVNDAAAKIDATA